MRWRSALAVSFSAVILAAACAQTGTTPSASPSASAAASQRGAGGDLKILYWQAPTILNPQQATGTKDNDASRLVIEPLAAYGPDGKPVLNGLTTEIPTVANGGVAKDFTTITWHLKPGLKWSDGTPFTADDVVFTEQYLSTKEVAAPYAAVTDSIAKAEAIDATTVKITFKAPEANFYVFGVGQNGGILQKKQFGSFMNATAKDAPGNLKPIGTGPYMVTDFKSGDVVTYAANPNYRDPNKPYFKTVTFKGGGDETSSARAVFQTGDVDYAWNLNVPPTVLKAMATAGDSKGTLMTAYGSLVERLMIQFADPNAPGDKRGEPDTKHPYFSDKNVRRALAMATDRQTIADQLYAGVTGKMTCNILAGVGDAESKATPDVCKFDLVAAEKLLQDNGWVRAAGATTGVRSKGGVKLHVLYRTTVSSVRQKVQDINKANWEKIGFEVELSSVIAGTFFTNTAPDGANHFWADVEEYANNSDPDPTTYMLGWTTQHIAQKSNNWNDQNYNRYSNPVYDALMASLLKETDQAKRAQLFVQANDILIQDVVTIGMVLRTYATSGYSKTLKGVNPNGWDSEMWNIADWSK